jgi:hypothetical protein
LWGQLGLKVEELAWPDDGDGEWGERLGIAGDEIVSLDFECTDCLNGILEVVPSKSERFVEAFMINGYHADDSEKFDKGRCCSRCSHVPTKKVIKGGYGVCGDESFNSAFRHQGESDG